MSPIVLFCVFAASVFGQAQCMSSAVYEANNYLDTVLGLVMPQQVASANLSVASLPGFAVNHRGESNSFSVRFDDGLLFGLGKTWKRHGDCQATQWHGDNITTTCYATLDGMQVAFLGTAKGGNPSFEEDVKVILVARNSSVRISLTERRKGHTVYPKLSVGRLTMERVLVSRLNVPAHLQTVFEDKLKLAASAILQRFVETQAQQGALSDAFGLIHLPLPQ
ncbi:uncharacterized protein LOC144152646 [Haemaphysalis longicornis]